MNPSPMTPMLSEITQSIYQEFNPLDNPGRQLLNIKKDNFFEKLIAQKTKELSDEQRKRIEDEIFGWGPIASLMERKDIFEIIIQGPENIFIETQEGMQRWPDQFFCQASFKNFIENLCKESKILINHKDPFGSGKFKNFRIHIAGPPICKEFNITLRRHQDQIIPFQNYLESGFVTESQWTLIQEIINSRANFLIVGPTGSGKTTLLNSLIDSLPKKERLVVLEDTDELKVNNPLSSKLLSREICPPTMTPLLLEDLVKQSLRMRPDRLVVGEVRGKEAKDLLQALATGHSGSMGTLHADNPQQALIRLEMLIQMGAPQWQIQAIRQLIQLSLDYIICLKGERHNKGIQSIAKIQSLEKFGFLLEDMTHIKPN